ncbi:MAG: hypothetical protein AAGD35_06140 [Actinomycetota bacterium]
MTTTRKTNPPSPDLLPSMLLRAAQGSNPVSAAVVMLIESGALAHSSATTYVMVDPEQGLAHIDWDAVRASAERTETDALRPVLHLAASIATDGAQLDGPARRALNLALTHLADQRRTEVPTSSTGPPARPLSAPRGTVDVAREVL